jgi:hypothetical protein
MTREFAVLSIEQLVRIYEGVSVEEFDALELGDMPLVRKLFDKLESIDREIRARGVEARRKMLPLPNHRNPQVRINAAKALLAIAPQEARSTLELLASRGPSIQRLDARMCIRHLEEGVFKPT